MPKPLPALPAKWAVGKVCGIRCRGGIAVDMQWNCQAGTLAATLASTRDRSLRLEVPAMFESATVEPASACRRGDTATAWHVDLRSREPLTLTFTKEHVIPRLVQHPGLVADPGQT